MASPRTFPDQKTFSPDRATQQREQTGADLAAMLRAIPFLRGRLFSVQFAASGTYYTFRHGLGTEAACIVVRQSYNSAGAAASLAENPSTTGLDTKNEMSLASTAACTIDLWFYPVASKAIATGRTQSL